MRGIRASVAILAASWMGFAGAARAATYTVNSTADDSDAKTGDLICATDSGECTLRAAIEDANASRGGDTVRFALDPGSVITIENGELRPAAGAGQLKIIGPGADKLALDGGGSSRVLSVPAGVTVYVTKLTIRNGAVFEGDDGREFGGGVHNEGTLFLTAVDVTGNTSDTNGGGIHNAAGGTLVMTSSRLQGNTSESLDGGGLWNEGRAVLVLTRVERNVAADFAGGILNDGRMTLTDSTVEANEGDVGGGGIENGGTLAVSRSTISRNISADHAAGIDNRGTMTLVNSTVSGNLNFDDIGGIENVGTLGIYSSTITANRTSAVVGGLYPGGTVTIANSIIAGNEGPEGPNDPQADCGIVSNPLGSRGYNIFGQGTGCEAGPLDTVMEPASVASFLGPLDDNGGPTQTHALLEVAGNPAIDGGHPVLCTGARGEPLVVDQRGSLKPAPLGGRCDVGAFELQPTIPFATFEPALYVNRLALPDRTNLDLTAAFRLGDASNGLDLVRPERLTLHVGPLVFDLPEGALRKDRFGGFYFKGIVGGGTLRLTLVTPAPGIWFLRARTVGADVSGIVNPVAVSVAIGDDGGSRTIQATIKK